MNEKGIEKDLCDILTELSQEISKIKDENTDITNFIMKKIRERDFNIKESEKNKIEFEQKEISTINAEHENAYEEDNDNIKTLATKKYQKVM